MKYERTNITTSEAEKEVEDSRLQVSTDMAKLGNLIERFSDQSLDEHEVEDLRKSAIRFANSLDVLKQSITSLEWHEACDNKWK